MTSNFALSLSFDGIRLLHRVAGGWHLAGEVQLDVPDLAAALANLRKTALALDPSGLRTKLLLPNEQIKYISLDTTRTEIGDIRDALDGATPYAVDDLVFDFDRSGGRTHIAAVARETLDEAEAFATEHNFSPICFAAISEPFTFTGEVFFGPTKAASDILGSDVAVTRDEVAVSVIGMTKMPAPPSVDAPEEQDSPEEPEAAPILPPDTPSNPKIVFASRSRPTVTVDPPVAVEPVAQDATSEDEAEATDEPLFTRRTQAAPLLLSPEVSLESVPEPNPEVVPEPESAPEPTLASTPPSVENAPEPVVAAPDITEAPAVELAAPVRDQKPEKTGFISRRKAKPAVEKQAEIPESEKLTVFGARKPAVNGKPKYLGLILTGILILFMALVALWANTLSPTGIVGWFFNAVEDPAEVQVADVEPIGAPILAPEVQAIAIATPGQPILAASPLGQVLSPAEASRIYAATGVWQRAPRLPLLPQGDTLETLSKATNITLAPSTPQPNLPDFGLMGRDLVLLAPHNPPAPGVRFARDLRGFILATPEGTITPEGVLVIAGRPDKVPPIRFAANNPEPVVIAQDAPQPAEIAADAPIVSSDGLVVIAGPPPIVPPLRPFVAPPQVEEPAQIATAAPEIPEDAPEGLVVIAGRPPVTPPLRPDSAAAFAASRIAPPTETITPGGVSLAAFRPATRPEGIIPQTPPTPSADPALAGFRPQLRPAGLAPEQVAETPTPPEEVSAPDINAVLAAIAEAAPPSAFVDVTARAIAASPRPDTRPRNFARVVARAQSNTARQQTQAAAVRAAAPVASAPAVSSGPIPGGVARAATMENAIRLRDVNLIGVYGRPNARRALVRMGNGRYVKVEVGDRLDGGQVTAIGDSALNYVVRGRTYALQLPSG